jgi:hypothetical protein
MASSNELMSALYKVSKNREMPRVLTYKYQIDKIEQLKEDTVYNKKVLFLTLTSGKDLPLHISILRQYIETELNLLMPIILGVSSDLSTWQSWKENEGEKLMSRADRDNAWTAFSKIRKSLYK